MPDFNKIVKEIKRSLSGFDKSIPGLQDKLFKEVIIEIKRLDTKGDRIAVTVKNLSILASIKNKLNRIILNKEYVSEIKDFVKSFNEVYKLQFEYWKAIEKTFKPKPLLKAIRNQAITDTFKSLTTQGISANVSDAIIGILRTNITTGGSYANLTEQLRQSLVNTPESKGILDKYVKTVAKDSINQFSRQYTQVVSSDLGYVWFRYMNSDIETTRCFCDAMTDKDYFHISEVPGLLKGKGLKCDGEPVAIYKKTGLPYGMVDGTNAENFFVRAGGWNCGHSIQPVAERQVPKAVVAAIEETAEYKSWKGGDQDTDVGMTFKNNRVIIDGVDFGKLETTRINKSTIEIDKLYLDKDKQKGGIGKNVIENLFSQNPDVKQIKAYPLASSEPWWARMADNIDREGNNFITRESFNKSLKR